MERKRAIALVLIPLLLLAACNLPRQAPATLPPLPGGDKSSPTEPAPGNPPQPGTVTSDTPNPPSPVASEASGAPLLTLDTAYFCRYGPGRGYIDIVDFPAGTALPIIGGNGAGWWLVRISDARTSHTECWIGGGVPSGDIHAVPSMPAPVTVPAHDPTNWPNVVHLSCYELATYNWTWNGTASGEYFSLTTIRGIARATIVYTEYNPICPSFMPNLLVPIHDKDSGGTLGHTSCDDFSALSWYWGVPGGGWIASTSVLGSSRATFDQTELSMNCPSVTAEKVVPVHGVTWAIVGYLRCSELRSYSWSPGAGSGEYVAAGTLFGSSQATINYPEYNAACPGFTP